MLRECKNRIPVIAGTGSNSTSEAVELSKFAEKAGSDGLLDSHTLLQQAYTRRTLPALQKNQRQCR